MQISPVPSHFCLIMRPLLRSLIYNVFRWTNSQIRIISILFIKFLEPKLTYYIYSRN